MVKLIPLLVLLVAGCARSTVPHAFLPEGYSDDEIQVIREQAARWVSATNGKCHAIIVESCDDDSCSVIRNESAKVPDNLPPGYTVDGSCVAYESHHGLTLSSSCSSSPDADRYVIQIPVTDRLAHTVLHEIGHTLGADDMAEPGHVMSGEYNYDSPELTATDLSAVKCR
jgi:hypothetical protein